jgi:hypothetical protein
LTVEAYEVPTDALVDSGANISVFRQEICEYFDLEIESGEEILLQGLGGRVIGYIHEVRMSVEQLSFACKVVFSKELTVGMNILGRQDFFEMFKVTFDERNNEVILESY